MSETNEVDAVVIFCCRECGFPTDSKGKPLDLGYDEAGEYLKRKKGRTKKRISAQCCMDEEQKLSSI